MRKLMPSETWKLLNDVRMFIEREYSDPAVAPDGEWLTKEARPIHDRLCIALAAVQPASNVTEEVTKAQNYLNDAVFVGLSDQEIARRARMLITAVQKGR